MLRPLLPSFLSVVALTPVIVQPTDVLTATVTPLAPRQGDTLQVSIQSSAETPPQVRFGPRTIPVFAIGAGQYRALIPTTPVLKPGGYLLTVQGATQARRIPIEVARRSFPVQRIWLPPGKSDLGTDFEFDRVDAFKALITPELFWTGPLRRPAPGRISTGYGVRRYYNGVFAEDYFHRGLDYADATGTPVRAPAAGRIALVGYEQQGFEVHGNTIGIDHGQGIASILIHLNRINVREGQFVQAGDVIGTVGNTGASTGPHLHWGFYVLGESVDPTPWLQRGLN
ncbi:M23 family metallopeptidase [Synechococcus elongatus]|uniref:Probable peptidase n=1 Tax=Synechococcus elongatus (strain ATCC 33912 / PCC 7942 / FACHB-805) TaxID=1140 RepID=Q31LW4_SYNE7|nr:M23 family metallopeptidase [Synechococcus elongatus]ABB57955.1 probable peptidase [Synechococcus elongatus PCC 7942 = FACHB-805]AJD57565.1 peptidase [Synechococcus elongatus UTEX 2973]MBD2586673.1 M23 family metallopeptidase [Synechococcus elongatus FACHB-242]MBD2687747.1 M23 family metallopeptidase [Synechococcus elongatus FACHB-1061]MBD2706543.1 M23 family metallopeptidase [Synechococcus elongatus PCC 7942 = FACHB-805]